MGKENRKDKMKKRAKGGNKKLPSFAKKSSIMGVKLEYDGEVFEYNLNEELTISDSTRDQEIINHPRSYAFLLMLSTKLKYTIKSLHRESKTIYAKRLKKLRDSASSVKEAELMVLSDKHYLRSQEELNHAEELKDIVDVSVRAFEERKDLLQTLSANTRKQL